MSAIEFLHLEIGLIVFAAILPIGVTARRVKTLMSKVENLEHRLIRIETKLEK